MQVKNISTILSRRDFLKGITGTVLLCLTASLGLPLQTGAAEKSPEQGKMKKYVCTLCGYIYDPEKGDPYHNIPPGTPFEKLPDYWVCPQCGAEKSDFQVYE
jgi:rubredoxin